METLQRTANRGSISTGFDIDNSLKIESDNSERLSLTLGTPTSAKIITFSWWFKRTELGRQWLFTTNQSGASGFETFRIYLEPDDELSVQDYDATNSYSRVTDRMFRDTSAWYHIVVAIDTTQATASNRIKVYVNGVQETSFGTDNPPAQNHDIDVGSGKVLSIGAWDQDGVGYLYEMENYISEVYFIDGQQLAASDFGESDEDTGIWKPIAYTGSYGNNGFYLKFNNAGSLGADSSGNGNNFTLNNITSIDQATDTPVNNFCTLHPLINYGYPCTISNGAVKASDNSVGLGGAAATFAVNAGKWWYEFQTNGANTIIGVQDITAEVGVANNAHEVPYTMGLYLLGEYNYVNDSSGGRNDGAVSGFVHANSNWYGIALNMDDNEIEYYVNGVQKGPTFSLDELSDLYLRPFVSSSSSILYFNFGGLYPDPVGTNADANGYGNFQYSPPTGYYALCTKNLAEFG